AGQAPVVAHESIQSLHRDLIQIGPWALFLLFLRAYSLGGGTYTGIEAVSNGIGIMREPRVETGKRTMRYMAASLAATASGLILAYLLAGVTYQPGKTLNASLVASLVQSWELSGVPIGSLFFLVTMFSEGAILFVAAQTG